MSDEKRRLVLAWLVVAPLFALWLVGMEHAYYRAHPYSPTIINRIPGR